MLRRLRSTALVLGLCAVSGCGFGATVGVDEVSLSAVTLRGSVGALDQDFEGNWYFEYWTSGVPGTHATAAEPFSARVDEQEPVSARITGFDQLGDPVHGLSRVRQAGYRICVARDEPPYGPLCSHAEGFQTGDYVFGSLAFGGTGYGMYGTIAAESGPDGEEPSGRVEFGTLYGSHEDIRGPVTCLRVSGTRAVFAVDNEAGANVLLYLTRDGIRTLFLASPPADLSACPDPRVPTGVAQSTVGALPRISDGP